MKKAKETKLLPAPKEPEPVYEMVLSRDEVYRIVNATYHSSIELLKSQMFAIGNRGHAYAAIARRMDNAYTELIECGLDARFDVKFFLKEKQALTQVEVGKEKEDETTGNPI